MLGEVARGKRCKPGSWDEAVEGVLGNEVRVMGRMVLGAGKRHSEGDWW